ncbi:MAG TPA: hypothetical protein VLQ79_02800 [Myxococcaceae bacterium]|nr:hypothetical protein [Myxococcaceae bacterium]
MRTLRHLKLLGQALPLIVAASLAGCIIGTAESALRARVGKERTCPPDKLTVTSLGASAYRVEGCGPPETFVCVSYQGWVCTKEGGPSSATTVLQTVGALSAQAAEDERQRNLAQLQAVQQEASQQPIQPPIFIPPPPLPPSP